MIKVTRPERPAILTEKASEWTQALLQATTAKERKRAEKKYGHSEIKNALKAMFHGKCAYCESNISHVAYGHIEHFRPKAVGRYPQLAFEWSNLFLACEICNGAANKGVRFPEAVEGGPLVNPCDDDPSEHLCFHYDRQAQLASVLGKTQRGKMTEETLGLNRHELRIYRSRQVTKVAVLARLASSDAEARALLEEAKQDNAEYAAFSRCL